MLRYSIFNIELGKFDVFFIIIVRMIMKIIDVLLMSFYFFLCLLIDFLCVDMFLFFWKFNW